MMIAGSHDTQGLIVDKIFCNIMLIDDAEDSLFSDSVLRPFCAFGNLLILVSG